MSIDEEQCPRESETKISLNLRVTKKIRYTSVGNTGERDGSHGRTRIIGTKANIRTIVTRGFLPVCRSLAAQPMVLGAAVPDLKRAVEPSAFRNARLTKERVSWSIRQPAHVPLSDQKRELSVPWNYGHSC